jgi:hypothetical protein
MPSNKAGNSAAMFIDNAARPVSFIANPPAPIVSLARRHVDTTFVLAKVYLSAAMSWLRLLIPKRS